MVFLAMAEPGSTLASELTGRGPGLFEIVVFATIGIALVGIVTVCWNCLSECRKWRYFGGRSVFWPLIR